jgi:glycosyltransferase involved in cell wall biosynthesis
LRITISSNAPWAPTGYGTQTAQLTRRLVADGHDVVIASNYGEMARISEWEGVPVFPGGALPYSTDILPRIDRIHDADLLIGLYDTWVITQEAIEGPRHVAWWTPIDHDPAPPKVQEFCRGRARILSMSRFGERTLAKDGIPSTYIPHGIDPRTFRPTPSGFRAERGIPDDAFLVTINAANNDNAPSRKAWFEMLVALKAVMDLHPDIRAHLHTDVKRPKGMDIPSLVTLLGMDRARITAADPMDYRLGAYDDASVAAMYTASDVLLATSRGEGFGLAVPEAMACGTPAIVTDFSAQPELIGDTGWRVAWEPEFDSSQFAIWARPLIGSIVQALLAAHAEKGTQTAQERRSAAMAHALQYDADRVYAEHWRPFLAGLESRPRAGNTKAAKRRSRKAA